MLKKLFGFIAAVMVAVSCSDSEPDAPKATESIKISDSAKEIIASDKNQTAEIQFETSSSWTARVIDNSSEWIAVSPTRGDAGKSTISIEVSANETYDMRTGRLVLSTASVSDTLTIRQAAKGAIVIADKEYSIDYEGGEIMVYFATSVPVSVTSDANWVTAGQAQGRALEEKKIALMVKENTGDKREATVSFSGGDVVQTIRICQLGVLDILEKERRALVALYNSTNGDNWGDEYGTPVRENWLSSKPVGTWNGVTTDKFGRVVGLGRTLDNLTGKLPDEIGDLENLEILRLSSNKLEGSIPATLGNCKKLKYLYLEGNKFEGSIPVELFNCTDLEVLEIGFNPLTGELPPELGKLTNLWALGIKNTNIGGQIPDVFSNMSKLESLYMSYNQFTGVLPQSLGKCTGLKWAELSHNHINGEIPESYGALPELLFLELEFNNLSGNIPSSISDNKKLWEYSWGVIVYGNKLNTHNVTIPAPKFRLMDIDKHMIISQDEYAKNELTILFQWNTSCVVSGWLFEQMNRIYNQYHSKGLDIIGLPFEQDEQLIRKYLKESDVKWRNIITDGDNQLMEGPTLRNLYSPEHTGKAGFGFYPTTAFPGVTIVDKSGNVVFSDVINNPNTYEYFIKHYLTSVSELDGKAVQLQKASQGNGVDLVLMGDGFTENDINSGKYESGMKKAMEAFFGVEPYTSYRDFFNVNMVYAVSDSHSFTDQSTALGCWFGQGTTVGGDDSVVFGYASKVLTDEQLNNSTIIVVVNSANYAGTCYMYCAGGGGPSIAYVPLNDSGEGFSQLIHHEAGGHGFGKLADEYSSDGAGLIPSQKISEINTYQTFGRYCNVTTNDNADEAPWIRFIKDARYEAENIGLYEGAYTYERGVYRPTEYSIMRYNAGGFNAPSREIIWSRINRLAYGSSWNYQYEDFVRIDQKNIGMNMRSIKFRRFTPTAPPKLINKNWKQVRKRSR